MSKSTPAAAYLKLIRKSLAGIRRDVPRLADLGEAMARPLLAGGNLSPSRVAKFWPSEFTGRAGGLMGLRWSEYVPRSKNDVAWFALPDPRRWDPRKDEMLQRLIKSPGQLFVNGRPEDLKALGSTKRFAGFTGGAAPDAGLGGTEAVRPLAPLRPFEQFVRGWATTGELIAACIRAGRMPAIWMSVWLEGAMVRNASFMAHNNRREPWSAPFFHNNIYIPPLAPGHVAGAFLDFVEGMLRTLEGQTGRLAQAGRWMAEAYRAKKRIHTVATGHSYPEILERPEKGYPIEWGPSISDLTKALPGDLGRGDVSIHFGYSPVMIEDVRKVLARGIRFIYTSPFGRPAALKDHRNLLWLDLPWRPADACIDVPGYSVRILPSSSSAHTMAYFAMVAEMAHNMQWC